MKQVITKGMERLIEGSNRSMVVLYLAGFVAMEPDTGPDAEDGHDWQGFPGGCERLGCEGVCEVPTGEEEEAISIVDLTISGVCLNTKQSLYDAISKHGDPQMLSRFWFAPLPLGGEFPLLSDATEPHVQDLTVEGFFGHEVDEDGLEIPTGRADVVPYYIPWDNPLEEDGEVEIEEVSDQFPVIPDSSDPV
jgi:hypothetical protein